MKRNIYLPLLTLCLGLLCACNDIFRKTPPPSFFDFLRDSPERISIRITVNDTLMLSHNDMISAKTGTLPDIVTAQEFARQYYTREIADSMVSMTTLGVYYLGPKADWGHLNWYNHVKSAGLISSEDKIHIREVIRGILQYKSMANTEYLGLLLGPEKINLMAGNLGLKEHRPIIPFPVSNFLLFTAFDSKEAEGFPAIPQNLSFEKYLQYCHIAQTILKRRPGYIRKLISDHPFQTDNSHMEDWQPYGTAEAYHAMVREIAAINNNNGTRFFPPANEFADWRLSDYGTTYRHLVIQQHVNQQNIAAFGYADPLLPAGQRYKTEIILFLHQLSEEERMQFSPMAEQFIRGLTVPRNKDLIVRLQELTGADKTGKSI